MAESMQELRISVPLSGGTKNLRERRRRALEGFAPVLEHLLEDIEAGELEVLTERMERSLKEGVEEAPEGKREVVEEVTGGRRWTPGERAALEVGALMDSFRFRRELLAGSLTAPEVGEILGTSRQTPHDRAKSSTLLGVMDRGSLRFPTWQFDPEGPEGVVEGLPEVLEALEVSPLAKASWLVTQNHAYLSGRTPMEALREGEVEEVVHAASAVGAS